MTSNKTVGSRTPLPLKAQRTLIGRMVQGFPDDLTEEEWRYWDEHRQELHRAIRQLLRYRSFTPSPPFIEILPLTVKYGKTDEQIVAGNYHRVDDGVNSRNFPTIRTGKLETEAVIFHFNRHMGSDEVEKELDARGFRPGNLDELLALGIRYPDKQEEFPIVALGSVTYRQVPCLERNLGKRILSLCRRSSDGGGWNDCFRFLAFRKLPPTS